MATNSYDNARRQLVESAALNAKLTHEDLLNDRTMLRYWPSIPFGKVSECLDFLRAFTSVKNPTEQHFVDAPSVNKESVPGRWHHVQEYAQPPKPAAQPDVQDVYQLLQKDWITEIDWTDARLAEGKDLPIAEGYRTIEWRWCDPAKLVTLAASLNAATYTGQTVRGNVLAGVWHNIRVTTTVEKDGSGTVSMYLAQPQFTLTAYAKAGTAKETATTYFWQVPKLLAAGILAANRTAGASASCSYPNASGLVDIVIYGVVLAASSYLNALAAWCAAYREFTDYYWDLDLAARDALVLTAPPQGWIYHYAWNLTGDALWDVRIEKHHDLDQVSTSVSQTAFETNTVIRHTENATALPAPAVEVGKVKNNQNANTPSGNFTTHEDVKAVIQSVISFSSAITDTETTLVEKGRNTAALPVLAAVAGAAVHLDGDKNDAQRFDYHRTTVTSNIPLSCPGLLAWATTGGGYWMYDKVYDVTEKRWYAVTGTWWREQQIHALQYFKTGPEAVAAMPGILTTLAGAGYHINHGSRPNKVGDNLWEIYVVIYKDYGELINADLGGKIWL